MRGYRVSTFGWFCAGVVAGECLTHIYVWYYDIFIVSHIYPFCLLYNFDPTGLTSQVIVAPASINASRKLLPPQAMTGVSKPLRG